MGRKFCSLSSSKIGMRKIKTIEEANERIILLQTLQLLGAIFYIVGMFMNFRVIVSNKGMMPVQGNYLTVGYEQTHFNYSYENRSSVPYWYLSDIIYVGNWIICSIGDITLWMACGLLLWSSVLNLRTIWIRRKIGKEMKGAFHSHDIAGPVNYNIILRTINSIFKRLHN